MNKTLRKTPLKEGEMIPIVVDYVFTNIFNNPNRIILLENFLSCYLEIPVNELKGKVKLLNRNLILEHKRKANKQVDLLVDIKGEKINIEMQNQMLKGIIDRNIAFACKVHARQL